MPFILHYTFSHSLFTLHYFSGACWNVKTLLSRIPKLACWHVIVCCTVVHKKLYFSIVQFHPMVELFQPFSEKLSVFQDFLLFLYFNWIDLDGFEAQCFANLPITKRISFSIPEQLAHSRMVTHVYSSFLCDSFGRYTIWMLSLINIYKIGWFRQHWKYH